MNVFEDLVVELKQENLLDINERLPEIEDTENAFDETAVPNADTDPGAEDDLAEEILVDDSALPEVETASSHEEIEADDHRSNEPQHAHAPAVDAPGRPKAGSEFFKKKAVAEVSALQMVEHVITGVEREYLKIVPKPFDDFEAKKALSAFVNVDAAVNSEEHATAEYNLLRETEAWCTALAARDRDIPVSSLRQYCERSRPALSSQALLALGRFYRNLPYSEGVRSKFDFVITRLFSRSIDQEKRVCLFTRDEMFGHINTLYSDWASVPLYAVDEDDSKELLTALSFEDLAIEAESARVFDQLIENDFFGRLRMFKESIAELFYAPNVTAAAIDANIRIGNAYVVLIDREREKLDAESLHLKYAEHDIAVSEMTGKTLELPDLLRQLGGVVTEQAPSPSEYKDTTAADVPSSNETAEPEAEPSPEARGITGKLKASLKNVNKLVVIFAVLMVTASVGVYVWANYTAEAEQPSNVGVRTLEVRNTLYSDYVKAARISGDMLYAQMTTAWDALPKEKRLEVLQKIYQTAQESSRTQVTLIGTNGKHVGYASASRTEVVMP